MNEITNQQQGSVSLQGMEQELEKISQITLLVEQACANHHRYNLTDEELEIRMETLIQVLQPYSIPVITEAFLRCLKTVKPVPTVKDVMDQIEDIQNETKSQRLTLMDFGGNWPMYKKYLAKGGVNA
tara:strand:- start:224 stop:604 length:381 start_codon:yes stop_codon:yes gene_type:complete